MTKTQTVRIGLTGLLAATPFAGFAENIEELEPLTVLARKFSSGGDDNASSVGIVTADELERMQRHRLLDALDLIPGTQALSTAGLTGNTGSALIRGLPTNYQQVVIDGVKIADATNGLGNFLANAQTGGLTGIEVLSGPQSVLYGTGAGGGVIGYETRVGTSDPVTKLFGEAGSFDSYRASISSEGRFGDLSYGLELGRQFTSNDTYAALPLHDYEQDHANLALQWQAREDLRFKLTYRGTSNFLKTTSIGQFGPANAEIETDTSLIALNAWYEISPTWQSRLTLGYYQENYVGNFDGFIFATDYERYTANWNNEIELGDSVTAIAGVEFARSDYANSTGRAVDFTTTGFYTNLYYTPIDALQIELGGRYDEHDEFGGDSAWNLGAVYRVEESGTRVHARYSEAYRNPTVLDSEFFPSFFSTQLANPDLESEEIDGFEIGVSQTLGDHRFGLTYFDQSLKNAIVTTRPDDTTTLRVNSTGSSRVSGFEVSAEGHFLEEKLRYRLAWTAQEKEEVIDLPDHLVSFDLSYQAESWTLGVGASYVDGAAYLAAGNPQTDSRFTTRLYGEYRINEAISIHGRIENLFDEGYELFPDTFGTAVEAPGRAYYLGATVTF